ncbi:MAG: XDD3 family exosortase-dependent surface protein [Leptolyngbyaceae cyanobacterium]
MNISKKTLIALAGCALASASVSMAPAQAQELNGWNYAIDSFDDGSGPGGTRGTDSPYEFYGLAIRETADRVYVGINSNLGLGGEYHRPAADDYIHYGDLFFNFTGESLANAQGQSNFFGIKFDEGNDSDVGVGVYSNVTTKNVTATNHGWSTLAAHDNWANNGGTASMGHLSNSTQVNGDYYFQQGSRDISTSIRSGTFVGGIEMLDGGSLAALGLNFQSVDAAVPDDNHTFGFSFARDLMVDGDYVAHILAECINDGLAITGSLPRIEVPEDPTNSADVPEPALATGLVLMGGLGLLKKGRKEMAEA